MNFLLDAIAADPNVGTAMRKYCREESDRLNLLARRHVVAKHRQYEAEPVSITGFGPLAPCFRRFEDEVEMTPAEMTADAYQDSRITQSKEDRHFGRGA